MKLNQYENRLECPFCGYTAPIEEEGNEDALIEITHIEYKRENDLTLLSLFFYGTKICRIPAG